ncbi:hypothetical protein N9B17_00880 [Rhodopirellula sp.]|nr:hypothetical protein [Rhodopirellula sp.]MDB4445720.1 hypothetical protein [bacterium]
MIIIWQASLAVEGTPPTSAPGGGPKWHEQLSGVDCTCVGRVLRLPSMAPGIAERILDISESGKT